MADQAVNLNFSPSVAYRNKVASLQYLCNSLNASLKFVYLGYFNGEFLGNLLAGRTTNTTPKDPPPSWVIINTVAADRTPDMADLDALDISQTGPPVCAVPLFHLPIPAPVAWFRAG